MLFYLGPRESWSLVWQFLCVIRWGQRGVVIMSSSSHCDMSVGSLCLCSHLLWWQEVVITTKCLEGGVGGVGEGSYGGK